MVVSRQLNYTKTRRFHAIFMPVIIEFSRCIGTYSSAKFEFVSSVFVEKGAEVSGNSVRIANIFSCINIFIVVVNLFYPWMY